MTSKAFVLAIFAFFILAFVPSNIAESPAEMYWKIKMGEIRMPKTLKDSLQLGADDEVKELHPNFKINIANEERNFFYAHRNSDDQFFNFWREYTKISQKPQDGRVIYFTYDTLTTVGTKMKLHFQKVYNDTKFLPLYVSKSLPTTSDKLPVILNLLYVNPNSISAKDIEATIKTCENKGDKYEKRYCATSLEGMADYVTSILHLGKNNLMAITTEQDNDMVMEYTIQNVQKLGSDDNRNMVCHKLRNPYVVFLCHDIKSIDLYGVSLVGADRKQTKVVAVCHKDTSSWNPRSYFFEFLKTKPGGKPICHFVSADTVVWFRN